MFQAKNDSLQYFRNNLVQSKNKFGRERVTLIMFIKFIIFNTNRAVDEAWEREQTDLYDAFFLNMAHHQNHSKCW